jgi:3-dehydroquinate synthase
MITEIAVAAEQPYQVLVGHGLLDHVPGLLEGAVRVAVIHPSTLIGTAERLSAVITGAGAEVTRIDIPNGEAAKTADVAATCWSVLGSAGFTRSDVIIGLGGGSATDLAGFVAATWLRGVRLITVPTTVLGMVDAAVGGKTGINTAEGKNLVGAFWEPRGVVCDLELLAGLPRAEVISGLAEVIKCGFIADPVILDRIEADPTGVTDLGSPVLREVIERSIDVKAKVVSADLREATSEGDRIGRELINYGHTLGHAIERREDYRWRHGEAISIGMIFVAELSRLAGYLDQETTRRHRAVLGSVGLPTSYVDGAFDDLLATMAVDKKTRGGTLRFVILESLAKARILAGPDPDLLREAYRAIVS